MVKISSPQKSSCFTGRRLLPRVQNSARIDQKSANFEPLFQSSQRSGITNCSSRTATQTGSNQSPETNYSWLLQSNFLSSKAKQQVETSNRSKYIESSPHCSNFQDGNSGIDQKIDQTRRMGNIYGYNRRLLPYPHSSEIAKISEISDPKGSFSVQSSTFRNRDGTSGIHTNRQRGEVNGNAKRYSHSSVPRRLVTESKYSRSMCETHKNVSRSSPTIGLANQLSKIRAGTHSKFRFFGLPFQSRRCTRLSDSQKTRSHKTTNCFHQKVHLGNSKEAHVLHRDTSFSGKDDSNGKITYETISVVHKNPLAVSSVIGLTNSSNSDIAEASPLVGRSSKSHARIFSSSSRTKSPFVHRCFSKRLGSPLRQCGTKWPLVNKRVTAPHKHFRAKSSVFSSKRFQGASNTAECTDLLRQFNCSGIHQQRRRHSFSRDVCSDMEDPGFYKSQRNPDQSQACAWVPQCDSRCSIQKGQGDSHRVVTSSSDISEDLPSLAQANGRPICHKPKCQTSNICFSCPRQQGMGSRCIEHMLGGTGRLCILSSSNTIPGHPKGDHIPVSGNSDSPRVARDALVLGSSGSIHKSTPTATIVGDSVETTPQQQIPHESGVSQSPCLASGFEKQSSGRFSAEVAERIKAPQRESSRKVYQSRWSIFGKWCDQNQVEVTSATIPNVAEFLNYLFTEKTLKPATISGYRTAIADGLGVSGQAISKSSELNRLIASFFRDKPKPNKSIPTWDLSLVLLSLTKAPFEPLQEASMKWLTYKTVFLLSLASGKRRSEIHAWTHSSVSSRRDWSQVTLAPSPNFLAKNQLASEGPESIKPVIIPALSNILDHSLVEDMSLCPVRALRIYLDRTKTLRKDKHLLFLSLREGYTRDISRVTISQWLKQTILFCYEHSDQEDRQVSQVKAHDVRSMAASLAFKGGVSLEEILDSCFWRSHGTFTNYYLKDVCWQNNNIFKLGPIVAAQHIVSNSM